MAAGQTERVGGRDFDELRIVAAVPDESGAGRFAERDPELHSRRGGHDGFMDVLNGFDKM